MSDKKRLSVEVHTEFGEPRDLEYALNRITDDWVDNGQACGQTTLDLRDACKELLKRHAKLVETATKILRTSHIGDQWFQPFLTGEDAADLRRALVELHDLLKEE